MNNLKSSKPGAGIYTLYTIWGIICFCFFQFAYHYHFFYQEQNQLFLWSTDYLVTYWDKPGWFACMLGDFLTQFYYYQLIGPAILTLFLLWLARDTRCALQTAGIKGIAIPTLLSLIVITVEAAFCLDYNFRLSNVLAIWGGCNVFRVSSSRMNATFKLIKQIEMMKAKKGKKEVKKPQANVEQASEYTIDQSIVDQKLPHFISAFNIAITVAVCHWLFGSGVWVYALLVAIGCLNYIMYQGNYLRLGTLVVMMLVLLLGKRLYFVSYGQLYNYPSLGKFVMPQFDMEKTFAVDFEYYRGNYNKVMDIVEKEKEPNNYMKFYYNLVVAQNKGLSDNLLKFPDNCLGTFEAIGPTTSALTTKSLGELYWLLGDMTFASRTAIVGNINSPFSRNIRQIKRLAEINLVIGEKEAAKKYLRILQKTFLWRHWADRIFSAMGRNATTEEVATLKPYLDKQKFVNTQDTLRSDDNCYTIMVELAESNNTNNMAINYLLCTDLLLKDLKAFKAHYDNYYLKQPHVLYDPLYQQALALYLHNEKAPNSDWAQHMKRLEVTKAFRQYIQERGCEAYNNTYWYYYDKVKTPRLKYNTPVI